jgi:MFS family permease
MYSATNLVGNLISGVLLDRWGRKRPVLIGLLLTAVALIGYSLVQTPEQLLIVRAVHGLAASVLTPGAFAILGDAARTGGRARVMGTSGALIAVAAVLGPPLAGGMRDQLGFGAVFLVASVIMLIAAFVFWRFVQETVRPAGETRPFAMQPKPDYLTLWTRPALVAAYLTAFALNVGSGTLVNYLSLLLTDRGEPASRTGLAFTVYAAVGLAVLAGPLNRLSDRSGRFPPMISGLALVGVGLLILAAVGNMLGVAVGMAVYGLGFGLLFPAATALVTDVTLSQERGAAFGIFYAVYSGGVVVGSVLSGFVSSWAGEFAGAPFVVAAVVCLVASPILALLGRRRTQTEPSVVA